MQLLRTMVDELERRPLEWGDPQFDLLELGLTVYRRLLGRFTVSYAVDPANRLVYLRDIAVLPQQA